MTDQLTLALNELVPIPSWWPSCKYEAIIALNEWEVADCQAMRERIGIPYAFNAADLPIAYLPEGTLLLYTPTVLNDHDLCLAAHTVDKVYRGAWGRTADIDLYAPYYTFPNGTQTLFSFFTTIYSTETERFPEEWDIIDAG